MAWLSGWAYRKKITISPTLIDSTLTNFPVLISVTSTRIPKAKVESATGYDVVFTAVDGTTLLKHELVLWDEANNLGEYWVKIPSISSSANTEFYVYYGKSAQSDTTSTDTWDANFEAVYHLQSDGSDSTANGNDLTIVGATNTACKIGNGYSFDGNDRLYHAATAMATTDTQRTIESWTKRDGTPPLGNVANSDAAGTVRIIWTASTWESTAYSNIWMIATAPADAADTWYHRATVYIKNTTGGIIHYRNGASVGTGDTNNNNLVNGGGGTDEINIGAAGNGTQAYTGDIDEVRYSLIARVAAWIKATAETAKDTILTYGSEEIPVAIPTLTTSSTFTSIEKTTATGSGNITDTGGENCTERGLCWSTSANPTTADSKAFDSGSFGTGIFSKGLTGLSAGTLYHVRAYAINTVGTGYGSDETFTTKQTYTKTFTSDALLQKTQTKTFTANAILINRLIKTLTTDAFLVDRLTKTLTADALLWKTNTKTFTADVILINRLIKTFTADAYLQATLTKALTADAVLVDRLTKTFLIDALFEGIFTKTFTADAILTKIYPADPTPPKIYIKNSTGDYVSYTGRTISTSWNKIMNGVGSATLLIAGLTESDDAVRMQRQMYIEENGLRKFGGQVREIEYNTNFTAIVICKTWEINLEERKYYDAVSSSYEKDWTDDSSVTIITNLIDASDLSVGNIEDYGTTYNFHIKNDTVLHGFEKNANITDMEFYVSETEGGGEE